MLKIDGIYIWQHWLFCYDILELFIHLLCVYLFFKDWAKFHCWTNSLIFLVIPMTSLKCQMLFNWQQCKMMTVSRMCKMKPLQPNRTIMITTMWRSPMIVLLRPWMNKVRQIVTYQERLYQASYPLQMVSRQEMSREEIQSHMTLVGQEWSHQHQQILKMSPDFHIKVQVIANQAINTEEERMGEVDVGPHQVNTKLDTINFFMDTCVIA